MKSIVPKPFLVTSLTLAILLGAVGVLAQTRKRVHLNKNAFAFAEQLIRDGHVIADGKGSWNEHQPSADEENEFIRLYGFGEFAKWHLGVDSRFAENTKRRYKFPYGDFKNVHRCGVLAAKARARQYGYSEIEHAAVALESAISRQSKSNAHLWWPIRASSGAVVAALAAAGASTTQPFHAVKNASINSGKSSL